MPTWLATIIKYIGLPLLKEIGAAVLNWLKQYNESRKESGEIDKAIKDLKKSKTKQEIIEHLRKLSL